MPGVTRSGSTCWELLLLWYPSASRRVAFRLVCSFPPLRGKRNLCWQSPRNLKGCAALSQTHQNSNSLSLGTTRGSKHEVRYTLRLIVLYYSGSRAIRISLREVLVTAHASKLVHTSRIYGAL